MTDVLDGNDVRRLLDEAPMSRLQIAAIAILVALSAVDGYDVVSISYAGPAMADAWNINKTALGAVFSSGLVGMAIGSLLLAPFADIWGRRAAIVFGLILMIGGGAWSALAGSAGAMAASRIVDGFGIGLLIAVTTPMAAEFANRQRRAFAVSVTTMAYPLGGVVGGIIAAILIREAGWQSLFAVKSIIALVLVPVVLLWLPESPFFLMSVAKPGNAEKLSAFLNRCGHPASTIVLAETTRRKQVYAELFAPGQAGITMKLVAANGLYAMVAFYIGSWLPQMVADAGQSASTASLISAMSRLSGVVGGLLLGFAARWFQLRGLTISAVAAAGISMILFGLAPANLPALTIASIASGFFLFGGVSGLYATIATSFGERIRASGTGLVLGVGRITSAVAPVLAGWMFANGFERSSVSATFAALAVIAALILALPFKRRNQHGA